MLCHLLTLNSITRRCKQLVLTDCQFIFSSLEWPQQALGCSGKGSIEIPHWEPHQLFILVKPPPRNTQTHKYESRPNIIKAHRQRCTVYPSGQEKIASRPRATLSLSTAGQFSRRHSVNDTEIMLITDEENRRKRWRKTGRSEVICRLHDYWQKYVP